MSIPIETPLAATGARRGAAVPAPVPEDLRAARALEAAFLAEMLRAAGTASARENFGGGIGEDHFASFMADAQADALMRRGGLGLAEGILRAMSGMAGPAPR